MTKTEKKDKENLIKLRFILSSTVEIVFPFLIALLGYIVFHELLPVVAQNLGLIQ